MKSIFRLTALAVVWTAFGGLSVAPCAQAVEPAQAFVDGLRERGFYDFALEYLDRAASHPYVPDEFKQKILYEEGVTLVGQAGHTFDAGRQEEKLDAAQAKFKAFIKAHSQDPLAPRARDQLAKVLMARGGMLLRRTERLAPAQIEKQPQLLRQARRYYDDAHGLFEASEAHYSAALQKTQKTSSSAAGTTASDRETMRGFLVQSQLSIAEATYERARTYPADSADYKTETTAAANKYKDLYEKNSRSLAGLVARLWQGRCYHDLGRLDMAIGCYTDLILQDTRQPAFRKLISKAYQGQAECYIQQAKYDEAIRKCEAWLAAARGAEKRHPDWLAVEYQLALAHVAKGRDLLTRNGRSAKIHFRTARGLARQVSQRPNDFQQPAMLLFAQLGPGTLTNQPKTFDEAYETAIGAIDLMKSSQGVLQMARRNNPAQVDELQTQLLESRELAFESFRSALAMADANTDREKLNRARYYLCYLNYDSGRYFDAAVLGEFLVRKYPENAHARDAAKIAMAAYQRLYYRAGDDKAFESAKIVEIADYIITRWPDGKEGDDAYRMLVDFAVRQGDPDRAEQYLEKISPPRRAPAQIQIGLGYWSAYLRGLRGRPTPRPAPAALAEMKRKAQNALEAGIDLLRDEPPTATIATAALSLAQLYLDTSQYNEATRLLEDEQIGPLTLVDAGSPAVARAGFAEETYKAALRAYVSTSPPQRRKALQAMDALEQLAGQANDPKAAEKLTKILISLGRQLERVIEDLDRQGRASEAASVAIAFEDFLDRASKRSSGNTWASRNWIAQTYFNLATGLDNGGAMTRQTKTYYGNAADAYKAILEEAKRDKGFSPSDSALLRVKIRLAECLSKMRMHTESLEIITGILTERPNLLQAQLVAAQTYQNRGDFGEPQSYVHAIKGGHADKTTGKNVIWGWAKLSRIAYRYPQYRDTFYEARYNMNLCRLRFAMTQTGEQQTKNLQAARDDLIVMDLSYSDDAWIAWRPKFERLLKNVQRTMKTSPVGFEKVNKANTSKNSARRRTVNN